MPASASAQQADSGRVGVGRPPAADTAARRSPARRVTPAVRPPVSGRRAFLLSLAVPGLGQAALDRPVAGAIFVASELFSLGMLRKTRIELRDAERLRARSFAESYGRAPDKIAGGPPPPIVVLDTATSRFDRALVASRRTQVEDWAAALVFTHLIAGADAFVAAQLWDLPAQVSLRWLPGGALVEGVLAIPRLRRR